MTASIKIKLSRGSYTCPNTGTEHDSALFLSRADEPGVVYPFPDRPAVVQAMIGALHLKGLEVFEGLQGTEVFEESGDKSVEFEVYVTAPGSKEVH